MNARRVLIPVYLFLCLILGGSSRGGAAANVLLQLAALGVLAYALAAGPRSTLSRPARSLLLFIAAMLGLVLVQLVPLPPAVWTALPGREAVVEGFAMLGVGTAQWLPLSLSPADTVASVVWLLPAIAVVIGIVVLGMFERQSLALAIILAMGCSVLLGAVQLAGGQASPAYLYDPTNRGIAVGLFANANHMATLLVVSLPFIAALHSHVMRRADRALAASMGFLSAIAVLVVFVGVATNGSLAGIGLAAPVAAASLAIALPDRARKIRHGVPLLAGLSLVSAAVMLLGPFGNNLFGVGMENNAQSRLTSFSNTIAAAFNYAPVGSGIGTFVPVYKTMEDPAVVERIYMNNAHNDYLQLALETGLPGMILGAAFLIWATLRAVAIWREHDDQRMFEKAATVALAAILLHSIVDYPLRTAAISCLFAACVALMAKPRERTEKQDVSNQRASVHLTA